MGVQAHDGYDGEQAQLHRKPSDPSGTLWPLCNVNAGGSVLVRESHRSQSRQKSWLLKTGNVANKTKTRTSVNYNHLKLHSYKRLANWTFLLFGT